MKPSLSADTSNNHVQGSVQFRFYAELNAFLSPPNRFATFTYPLTGRTSVKHAIEALGVPHTQVDFILINHQPADFEQILASDDLISVYPKFETLNIASLTRLRARPLRETRFVLDVHLGKLAVYLRLLGFDCWYRNQAEDQELAHVSTGEERILLTRDRGLLKRKTVTHGYALLNTSPRLQAVEILRHFDLMDQAAPFRRCLVCNALLEEVSKEDVCNSLPHDARLYYDEFKRCPSCRRIYWKGSHYQRMLSFLHDILAETNRLTD